MKKYEFTGKEKRFNGRTLRRNRAQRDFGAVMAEDLGGWIEGEDNLSHDGRAWVTGDAAWVYGNADFSIIGGFGGFFRTMTFFRCQDGKIRTQCGCFYGDLEEFRAKVKKTHGESKLAKEYLMIADLMEMYFASEE